MEIDLLFNQSKANVIKKETIENGTDLMMVLALSELYLHLHIKPQETGLAENFENSLLATGIPNFNNVTSFNKLIMLIEFSKHKLTPLRRSDVKGSITASITDWILDITYDVCLKNPELQKQGFFNHPVDSARMKTRSLYYLLQTDKKRSAENKIIHQQMDSLVTFLAKYSYVINNQLSSLPTFTATAISANTFSTITKGIKTAFNSISTQTVSSNTIANLLQISDADKKNITTLFNILNANVSNTQADGDAVYYELNQNIIPTLNQMNISYNGKYDSVIKKVESLKEAVLNKVIDSLLKDTTLLGTTVKRFTTFVEQLQPILTVLNESDKVTTYDQIFKYVVDIGALYGEENYFHSKVFNDLINAVSKYASVDKATETVNIDVQSMASDFFDRYADETSHRLSFYFSVGVNVGNILNKGNLPTPYQSATYANEKIGLKIKLWDFNRQSSLLTGSSAKKPPTDKKFLGITYNPLKKRIDNNTNPIIDDIHIIGYTSGLLYKIATMGDSSNFISKSKGIMYGVVIHNMPDLLTVGIQPDKNNITLDM